MGTSTVRIQITEGEYKLLQTLVYQECGMYFDERRAHFLQDRLQRRMRTCNLDTFYAYYKLLTSHQGKSELAALGCLKINLQVLASNAETLAFYKKLGYTVEERISMGKLVE